MLAAANESMVYVHNQCKCAHIQITKSNLLALSLCRFRVFALHCDCTLWAVYLVFCSTKSWSMSSFLLLYFSAFGFICNVIFFSLLLSVSRFPLRVYLHPSVSQTGSVCVIYFPLFLLIIRAVYRTLLIYLLYTIQQKKWKIKLHSAHY